MAKREKTKHKGIYKRGKVYYVIYDDGTKKISKDGEESPMRCEKKIEGTLQDALKFKVEMEEKVKKGAYYIRQGNKAMGLGRNIQQTLSFFI